MKRKIELVLDGDGDVIFVRFDHHSGIDGEGVEVKVPWPASNRFTPGASVVVVTYTYPPKNKVK